MRTCRRWLIVLTLGLCCVLLLFFTLMPYNGFIATPDQQTRWCECVDYVRNRFALPQGGGFVGAADMGPFLEEQGMQRVLDPIVGAVIVFPRGFGYGIDATYGHVGVVERIETKPGESTWSLTVRGARQNHREWSEHGCRNVSDMDHIYVPQGSDIVAFYVPGPVPGYVQVVDPLSLSHSQITTAESLEASFAIRNAGERPLQIELLTAGGRQGTSWDAPIQADFPHVADLTLQPDQVYAYRETLRPDTAGDYFAEPIVLIDGAWQPIAGAVRQFYTVQTPPPTPTATPAPLTATPLPTAELLPTPTEAIAVRPAPPQAAAPTVIGERNATPPDPPPSPLPTTAPPPPTAAPSVAPVAALPPEQKRWTYNEQLSPGRYRLRAWGVAEARIYLDGQLVFDGLTNSADIAVINNVPGGAHILEFVVYGPGSSTALNYTWEWQGQ